MVVVAREEVPETVIPLVEVATRLDPLSVQKLVTLTRQSTPLIEKQLAVEVPVTVKSSSKLYPPLA